jgi:hypothetical protein
MFSDKDRIVRFGKELEAVGIECTSRWAYETVPHNSEMKDVPDEYHRETARVDLIDVLTSNVFVEIVPSSDMLVASTVASASRGGRHFEMGLFYGNMLSETGNYGYTNRELLVIGKKENIFHHLDGTGVTSDFPAIKHFAAWENVYEYLTKKFSEEKNG